MIFAVEVPLMPFQPDHTLQLARKTLENAGIVLYSFASCPEKFVEHKKAYIELLKFLQANERQGNTELTGNPVLFTFHVHRTHLLPRPGRIRILLMPLTSNFTVQEKSSSLHIRSNSLQRHLRTTSTSCLGEGINALDSSSSIAQPATMLRE